MARVQWCWAPLLLALSSAACDDDEDDATTPGCVAGPASERDGGDAAAPSQCAAPGVVPVINQSIFDVMAFGAKGDGTADDTVAIQAAVDAAAQAGGGRVFFPIGKYRVAGPLKDPAGANAQIVLPNRLTYAAEPMPIVLEGPFPPATNYSLNRPEAVTERGAVIISDHKGGGSVIGSPWGPTGSFEKFSNIAAIFKNLIIRTYGNPDVTGLDLGHAFSCDLSDVIVDAGASVMDDVPEPTHPSAYGIIAPLVNNGALVAFNRVQVVGYYVGVQFSEHFTANLIQLWACKYGLEAGFANHASYIQRALLVWSQGGLRAAGYHPIRIEQFAIEHRNPTLPPSRKMEQPDRRQRHRRPTKRARGQRRMVFGLGERRTRRHDRRDGRGESPDSSARSAVKCSHPRPISCEKRPGELRIVWKPEKRGSCRAAHGVIYSRCARRARARSCHLPGSGRMSERRSILGRSRGADGSGSQSRRCGACAIVFRRRRRGAEREPRCDGNDGCERRDDASRSDR